jgi:hypothetical protein
VIVSIADIIIDQLGLGFGRHDDALLQELLPISTITEDAVTYYQNNYLTDIRTDPLFLQCRELFAIE